MQFITRMYIITWIGILSLFKREIPEDFRKVLSAWIEPNPGKPFKIELIPSSRVNYEGDDNRGPRLHWLPLKRRIKKE